MSDFLPKEVREDLARARKQKLRMKSRMRVRAGDQTFTVLRFWEDGFSLDSDDMPHLRGLVDLIDGGRHVAQCLIIASEEDNGERRFEFKRATLASDNAPLDYVQTAGPIGLLTHDKTG